MDDERSGAPHVASLEADRGVTGSSVADEPVTDDGEWLPATSGGRGRRWRRVLALLVVVLVLLPVTYGLALGLHANASITRLDVGPLPAADGTTNFLVVGSDSRADLTPEERAALTTGGDVGSVRTDTIMLLVTRGTRVAILSFPRDMWVERCDGTAQRINTAVQLGGLGCLADTVNQVSGIGIDHVVQVSFGGFVDVVDAVGGVELCLEDAIADKDAGIDLPAGCQVLDGADALGYVRVRKIDDDLQRIRRQQEFLTALADELVQPENILVPWRAWPLAGAVGGAVSADEGLGVPELGRLALAARGLAGGTAVRTTVPTEPASINGAQVLVEAADAESVYAAHRDGSVLDTVGAPGDDAEAREDVAVVVLNGAGIQGLAGATAEVLVGLGYPEPDLGNADQARTTTVAHPPQLEAEAERLADDVAGALGVRPVVRAGTDGTRLTLVLGTDVDPAG